MLPNHGFIQQPLNGYLTPRPVVLETTGDSPFFTPAGMSLMDSVNAYQALPPSVVPGPLPCADKERMSFIGESNSTSFIRMFEGLDFGHDPATDHSTMMGDHSPPAIHTLAVLAEESGHVSGVNTPLVPLVGRDGREVILEKRVSPLKDHIVPPPIEKSVPTLGEESPINLPIYEPHMPLSGEENAVDPLGERDPITPPGRTSTPAPDLTLTDSLAEFASQLIPDHQDALELGGSDIEELEKLNGSRVKIIKMWGTPTHYIYPLVSKNLFTHDFSFSKEIETLFANLLCQRSL